MSVFFKCGLFTGVFFLIISASSYAQKLPDFVKDKVLPPAGHEQGIEAQGEPVDVCAVPPGTELVHFPLHSWSVESDVKKTVQEAVGAVEKTADEAYQFITRKWNDLAKGKPNIQGEKQKISKEQDPAIIEEIAYPHFVLAKLIQKYSESFIFHELLTEVYDVRDVSALEPRDVDSAFVKTPDQLQNTQNPELRHLIHLVRAQFPKGLPETYSSLSKDQKYTLALIGGANVLLYLNEIPMIFPSFSSSDYKKYRLYNECKKDYGVFNMCSYSNNTLKLLRAEKLASIVKVFLKTLPIDDKGQLAIVVYNGDQDLQPYFSDVNFYRIPDSCISISKK